MAKTKRHHRRSKKHHRSTRRSTRRRGGRGDFTTGASATLAQMAPAPFTKLVGAGLAFLNGGRR